MTPRLRVSQTIDVASKASCNDIPDNIQYVGGLRNTPPAIRNYAGAFSDGLSLPYRYGMEATSCLELTTCVSWDEEWCVKSIRSLVSATNLSYETAGQLLGSDKTRQQRRIRELRPSTLSSNGCVPKTLRTYCLFLPRIPTQSPSTCRRVEK